MVIDTIMWMICPQIVGKQKAMDMIPGAPTFTEQEKGDTGQ